MGFLDLRKSAILWSDSGMGLVGIRQNPMKSDKIRLYFPGIPIGFVSWNSLTRNQTAGLDSTESFWARRDSIM